MLALSIVASICSMLIYCFFMLSRRSNYSSLKNTNSTVPILDIPYEYQLQDYDYDLEALSYDIMNKSIVTLSLPLTVGIKEYSDSSSYISSFPNNYTIPIQIMNINVSCESDVELFNFLISEEGMKIIDPITNPKEFENEPLAVEEFNGIVVEVRYSLFHLPFSVKEFEVCNIIDQEQNLFISNSINLGDEFASAEKIYNSFALQVMNQDSTQSDQKKCTLKLYNTVPGFGAFLKSNYIAYVINVNYCKNLVKRMEAHLNA